MTQRTPGATQSEETIGAWDGEEGGVPRMASLPPRWLDTREEGTGGDGWVGWSPMCPKHHAHDEYVYHQGRREGTFTDLKLRFPIATTGGSPHGRIYWSLAGGSTSCQPSLFIQAWDWHRIWLTILTSANHGLGPSSCRPKTTSTTRRNFCRLSTSCPCSDGSSSSEPSAQATPPPRWSPHTLV